MHLLETHTEDLLSTFSTNRLSVLPPYLSILRSELNIVVEPLAGTRAVGNALLTVSFQKTINAVSTRKKSAIVF